MEQHYSIQMIELYHSLICLLEKIILKLIEIIFWKIYIKQELEKMKMTIMNTQDDVNLEWICVVILVLMNLRIYKWNIYINIGICLK